MNKTRLILFSILLLSLTSASADGRDDLANGDAALDKNEPGPAIGHFTRAIESGDLRDEQLGDTYWKRAIAYFDENLDDLHIHHSDRIDGFESCLENLDAALANGKQANADFDLKSAQCREYVGLKEEAIGYYLKVLDQDTTTMNRGLSLYSLGLLYRDLGSTDDAELYFGKCTNESDPPSRIAKGCQRELKKMSAQSSS